MEEDKFTIVFCCEFDPTEFNIPYRYYIYESDRNSVLIYLGFKKIGELFIEDWQSVGKQLEAIIENSHSKSKIK